ncbi:MAG TPA: anti-sigma factor [Ktedonobacterales bacterium]
MSQEPTEHVTDLVPAYALGALEPAEVDAVDRHLAECAECSAEVQRALGVAEMLLAAPALDAGAPPALRQRVLDRVRAIQAEAQPSPSAPAGAAPTASADGAARSRGGLGNRLRALFGGDDASLYHPTGDLELDRILIELLLDPHCAVVAAPGAAEPGAFARFVATPTSQTGVLLTSGLHALAQDKAYQIWLLRDGKPVPNALFRTDRRGRGASLVRASGPVLAYDTVAVTPEPAGGSPGPTGPIVLAGALRST